jgi:hypothetical protein
MVPLIFSRRSIHLWPKDVNTYTALFVPSQDQVVTLRDVANSTEEIAQRLRAEGRTPLWRQKRGQITVYGFLPPELKDVRQSLRVWLAEDYAPKECSAFFFVIDKWVIHAIKEIDDERRETWRSTVMSYGEKTLVKNVVNAAADLLLRFPPKEICVAVDGGLERLEQFKRDLENLGIACQPFESLRPAAGATLLYRHRDYTVPMFLSLVLFGLLFAAMLVQLTFHYAEANKLQSNIDSLRRQIESVQISKSLGYIREPQPVLDDIRKPFQQQPSAILDAAARFGRVLGNLNSVSFVTGPAAGPGAKPDETGLMLATVEFSNVFDKMLVNQESATRQLLPQTPWIREVRAQPQGGSNLTLKLELQIGAAAGGKTVPSATSVFQPLLSPPEGASPTLPGIATPMPLPAAPVVSGAMPPALPPPAAMPGGNR